LTVPPNVHRTNARTRPRVRAAHLQVPPTSPLGIPQLYVYFDKLLHQGPLIDTWWFLRTSSWVRQLSDAVAIANYVRISTGPDYFEPGPNRVRYNPVIPNLRDIDDLFVAPFVFPVTVV
jgi:hypothetical protein